MANILYDTKYAFRQLRKSPCFTLVAALTLGLGIGATTSLFSVFNALVLDPLPYPKPDKIVYVWSGQSWSLSALDYFDIKEQMTSFADMGVYQADTRGVFICAYIKLLWPLALWSALALW